MRVSARAARPGYVIVTSTGLFPLGCNNVVPTANEKGTATYVFTAATLAAAGQQVANSDRHDPVRQRPDRRPGKGRSDEDHPQRQGAEGHEGPRQESGLGPVHEGWLEDLHEPEVQEPGPVREACRSCTQRREEGRARLGGGAHVQLAGGGVGRTAGPVYASKELAVTEAIRLDRDRVERLDDVADRPKRQRDRSCSGSMLTARPTRTSTASRTHSSSTARHASASRDLEGSSDLPRSWPLHPRHHRCAGKGDEGELIVRRRRGRTAGRHR